MQKWPIVGGSVEFANSSLFQEMLTVGHNDGTISFWNVTDGALTFSYVFSIELSPKCQLSLRDTPSSFLRKKTHMKSFQHVKLCPYARILAVSFDESNILSVFHTSVKEYPNSVLNVSESSGKGPTGSNRISLKNKDTKSEEKRGIVEEGERNEDELQQKEDEEMLENIPIWGSNNPFFRHKLEIRMLSRITCVELCSGLGLIIVGDSQVLNLFLFQFFIFLYISYLFLHLSDFSKGTLAIINLFKGEFSFVYSSPDKSPGMSLFFDFFLFFAFFNFGSLI